MLTKSIIRLQYTSFLRYCIQSCLPSIPWHPSKRRLQRPVCRLAGQLLTDTPYRGTSTHAEGATNDYEATRIEEKKDLEPGLYVVATPIGNLEDITLRALRILKGASVILAEDTRHSQKLLSFYGIQTRTISFHEHNEREKESKVCDFLFKVCPCL